MKKGFTLIEVLVSVGVFLLTFGVILSTYLLSVNSVHKYEEYQFFENICITIDTIYDTKKIDGVKAYFNNKELVYYNSSYEMVDNEDKYSLSYTYNDILIVSIKNNEKNYFVIENLDYGVSKAL
ncbi:unknown [Firmicutes bacterium CAG:449]|nr:unknown [Firmicutes bacterium CAG:449]